jgi:E3 ubiquitin-protein ligase DOA10
MHESCLVCLEEIKEKSIVNPIGCPCKLHVHKQCFETWFQQKNQMECPICHSVATPNRVMLENVHIVYINTNAIDRVERREKSHGRAIGFCCCLLIGWAIGFTVIDHLYGQ